MLLVWLVEHGDMVNLVGLSCLTMWERAASHFCAFLKDCTKRFNFFLNLKRGKGANASLEKIDQLKISYINVSIGVHLSGYLWVIYKKLI